MRRTGLLLIMHACTLAGGLSHRPTWWETIKEEMAERCIIEEPTHGGMIMLTGNTAKVTNEKSNAYG